jgi:hypothetical protein
MTQGKKSSVPTTIVPCPTCHAEVHHNCIMANGTRTAISHAARVQLFRKAVKRKPRGSI